MLVEFICLVVEEKEGDSYFDESDGEVKTLTKQEITGFTSAYIKFENIKDVQSTMDNKYSVISTETGEEYWVNSTYAETVARLKMYSTFYPLPMVSLEDLDAFLKDMRTKALNG